MPEVRALGNELRITLQKRQEFVFGRQHVPEIVIAVVINGLDRIIGVAGTRKHGKVGQVLGVHLSDWNMKALSVLLSGGQYCWGSRWHTS